MEVRLYVKPGCPLCDEARDWLEDLGLRALEVNILQDEATYWRFKDTVPVVEAQGRTLIMPFTRRRLRAWLARLAVPGSP